MISHFKENKVNAIKSENEFSCFDIAEATCAAMNVATKSLNQKEKAVYMINIILSLISTLDSNYEKCYLEGLNEALKELNLKIVSLQ
jgi:hypothetical protein